MSFTFLTDENISPLIIKALREKRNDVKDIKEERLYGIKDYQVLDMANKEKRIILTHDKDFLNLFLNNKELFKNDAIMIKYEDTSPKNVTAKFIPLLATILPNKIENSLIIVYDDFIKIIK